MKRLPRWAKLLICFIIIGIALAVLSVPPYFQPATARMAFRRAELYHMIGPAKITATLEVPYGWFLGTVLGESDNGYSVYSWGKNYGLDSMTYLEKDSNITLFCPDVSGSTWYIGENWQFPIFAFTDLEQADHGELTLDLTAPDGTSMQYQLTASFHKDGYAVFYLNEDTITTSDIGELLRVISSHTIVAGSLTGNATVYDSRGNTLCSITKDFDYSPWVKE